MNGCVGSAVWYHETDRSGRPLRFDSPSSGSYNDCTQSTETAIRRGKEEGTGIMSGRPQSSSPGNGPASESGTPAAWKILGFTAALLWLVIPIVVFFIFHKPLPSAAWERTGDSLIDLLAAGWIAWIGIGIGRRFLRGSGLNGLERTALSGALGLGALGLILLGVAWAGLLSGEMAALVCTGLTLLVSMPLVRDIASV
jgi:hypothetical protein